MRRAIDTNVLIYAHLADFKEHERVRAFLFRQLQDPELTLVITPGVLHEFVNVITDGRRFAPPVAVSEALAVARGYLERTNVECLGADESILLKAFDLLESHNLGRMRVADTLLAATLLQNGIKELVTCNLADFRVFEGLKLVDPRVS